MVNNWVSYPNPAPGEEIVICGISGSFPKCDNMDELKYNLYNGVDMITDDNSPTHPDVPKRYGRVKPHCLSEFDNQFFNIPNEQIISMDPMNRILMEKVYEAVIDAGLNPEDLRGTKTGVYTASSASEADVRWFFSFADIDGYGMIGNNKGMYANRISQWLDVHGPSYNVDTACSSCLYAVEHAYRDLRAGIVDYAIVGTANLCLSELTTLQFARLSLLAKDGVCRVFDDKATGYVRSETIGSMVLMRAKDAKRIYSYIVHSKNNCDGYKPQGITFPSAKGQSQLMNEFYKEISILPNDIKYVECHGTGTKVGDVEECISIEAIFCKDRKSPLKIGSVKSNLGHSEPSSGLCSIAKCILTMESGLIPPNLNYYTPRKEIRGLIEKKFEVVDKITPLEGDYIALSGFGFGGANSHLLLKRFKKMKKNNGCPSDELPRLICVSGRTQEAVNSIIHDLEKRPLDEEHVRLYHDVYRKNIRNHDFRGYAILQKTEPRKIGHATKYVKNVTSPTICYVFSGIGNQWTGMGVRLMEIPVFAATMHKLNKCLDPFCLNIVQIITDTNSKIFNNPLYAILGTTAIQIGLVDVLKAIGIAADNLIGYSIGEIACAYADNCLTAVQAILAAYYCGLASFGSNMIEGSMATFDLNSNELLNGNSAEINSVGRTNERNNKVISGSVDMLKNTSASIKERELRKELIKLIPNPRPKSKKWISSQTNMKNDTSDESCTAVYLAKIMHASVNLKENFKNIQPNTMILDISPDNGLVNILKDVDDKSNIYVGSLLQRNDNNLSTFLNTIGNLYTKGFNPQLAKLYPEVQFPVSRGTPMISPSVKWDHTRKWPVPKEGYSCMEKTFEKTFVIDVNNPKFQNLTGHVIDGRNLYPATGYLTLAWDALTDIEGELLENVAVEFEDVQFLRATNIPKNSTIKLTMMIQKGTGNFEILESDSVVVTGRIKRIPHKPNKLLKLPEVKPIINDNDKLPLNSRDIYKELRLRGYNYQRDFKSILSTDNSCNVGQIEWKTGYWAPFMDNMLQLQILQEDARFLYVPTSIQKLTIYPQDHFEFIQEHEDGKCSITVTNYKDYKVLQGGGIQIEGLMATSINRRKPLGAAVLEKQEFIPLTSSISQKYTAVDAMRIFFQLGLENQPNVKVKVVEVDNQLNDILAPVIFEVLSDLPLIQPDITVLSSRTFQLPNNCQVSDKTLESESKADYIVTFDLLNNPDKIPVISKVSKDINSFVISRENPTTKTCDIPGYNILCELFTENEKLIMLRKQKLNINKPEIIKITNDLEFPWLEKLQHTIKSKIPAILYSQNEPISGIIGLINCLRKEYVNNSIQAVFINDKNAPEFDCNNQFYKTQLDLGLAVNVYNSGVWGGYRHLKLLETKTMTDTAFINCTTRGDLSSMSWIELPLSTKPKRIIEICYSALNFRDIMTATGKLGIDFIVRANADPECILPLDCVQGLEYSGVGPDGKSYMGLVERSAQATRVECDEDFIWPVPDNWSLEDAATVPVVYSTVYASLVKYGMSKGHSVLIHSGTGGVGLAAIHVALHYGCEVFTTVGTQEKREYIRKLFPQIKESHIGNSRDTSFEQMVMIETKGRGVDYVLNSLAEEKLLASVRCLAEHGKFMEIGKFDLSKNNKLGMEVFMRGASFYGIMLDNTMHSTPEEKKVIRSMVSKGIRDGAVQPLPRTVFEIDNLEAPFRYMSAGKHIGKVLIKIRENEAQKTVMVPAIPKLYVKRNKSVVIIGGLGGFGLELANWLIQRGCKNLILSSRQGLKKGYQSIRVQKWRSAGINVQISTANILTKEGCIEILQFANQFGPVDGIYNLAVLLRDALFENQTTENFQISFGGKALGTKFLDEVSRTLCPELRHFVVFSSVSCGRGNAGQTNYGMANSVMERICEERHASGYPALAIQWGAIGEVGLVADMQDNDTVLEIGGTLQQNLNSCFDSMDIFLKQKSPIVASMVVAEKKYGLSAGGSILETVISIMGIRDYTTVSKHANLAEIGMDSMMAVEIKQTLEREFELFLTPQDIRNLSFSKLIEIQNQRNDNAESDTTTKGNSNSQENIFKMLVRTLGNENEQTEPIIELPSIKNNEKSIPLFFIPGIEGQCVVFEPLCSRLNHRCYGLQTPFEDSTNDISTLTQKMVSMIKSKLEKNEDYGIVGYSYGSILATEIYKELEKLGHKGRCLFIDGSPSFIKRLVSEQFSATDKITANIIESKLLVHLLSMFVSENVTNILSELENLPDWKSRVDLSISKIPEGESLYSEKYIRTFCNGLLARFQSVINYNISEENKLNVPVALVRPTIQVLSDISEDYDLSRLVDTESSKIAITVLDGDHYTVLENSSLPNLANEFFS
ncbi:fatty acid synthase-like [Chrysoperla carnea]|uniref:fatty acid synthase-like n=1 Tax=Chrysoperla carnea TaxID=189513 RepID=UPI001D05CECC|nr:fatty acid synthase-like [Chrysoperla carnea]